jgi:hypothetical protein
MLDVHKTNPGPVTAIPPADSRPAVLPTAIRGLFARLAGKAPAFEDAPAPHDVRARRTLARQERLRAEAHAAFRSVEGPAPAALDAALAVLESEIARLSDAAEAYGEALKSVRTYDDDPAQRAMAAAALYAFPVPLRAPDPVPQTRSRARHG